MMAGYGRSADFLRTFCGLNTVPVALALADSDRRSEAVADSVDDGLCVAEVGREVA